MDLQKLIEGITEIFDDVNPLTIKPDVKFREIDGYSSLTAFLLISMINDEFDVNFTGDDLRRANTINDIFSIIKSKMSRSPL